MAYNQGLTQEEKDRINKQIKELAAQGKSKQEILAWRNAQVDAARKAAETGKPSPTAAEATGSGDSLSDAGSSESPTWGNASSTFGVKRPRVDDDGEVINLAEDFGEVGAMVESIPFIGDFIDDMYGAVKSGYAQGQTVDDALGLFTSGADADPEEVQKYIEAVKKMQNQPISQEMMDFNETYEASGGGTWGFLKAIAQNPSVAATTAVSSMIAMINPGSAAGAAIGAGGGAAVGAGFAGVGAIPGAIAGGFAGAGGILETGVSFTEFLQEELEKKGLEFNEEGVSQILEDEDAMFRIRGKSAARGGVIGIIDGITGGIASKAVKGVAGTAKKAARIKGALAGLAIEGAGGGIGEASARLAVGQELDAREIGLEIVGEFGTGLAITKAALATQPKYEINGQQVNRNTVEATIKDDPATAANIKVSNDPEIQNQINSAISGSENINDNADIITEEESKARKESIDNIAQLKKEQKALDPGRFKSKPAAYKAYDALIKQEQSKLKDIVKDQNRAYQNLSEDEKNILRNSKAEINNFDAAINEIQNKYKEGETISTEDQNTINKFNDLKTETLEGVAEVRAKGIQLADEATARYEAKKQEQEAAQQEIEAQEAVEAQAEEEGVDVSQVLAQKEEAEAIIDEEATDNTQKTKRLKDNLIQSGVRLEPVEGAFDPSAPDNYVPLSKKGDNYSKGDFEQNIVSHVEMDQLTAQQLQYEIQDYADDLGATTDVEIVPQGEGFGLVGKIQAAKRPEPVSVQVKQQQAEARQLSPEEAEVKSTERAQAIAEEAGFAGAVTDSPEGIVFEGVTPQSATQDKRPLHKTANSLKKRGYPEAYVDIETGTVVKGPYQPETATDEFKKSKKKKGVKSEGVLRQQQQAASLSGVHKDKKKQIPRKRKHKGRDEFSVAPPDFEKEFENTLEGPFDPEYFSEYGIDVSNPDERARQIELGKEAYEAGREYVDSFIENPITWEDIADISNDSSEGQNGPFANEMMREGITERASELGLLQDEFSLAPESRDNKFQQHEDLRGVSGERVKLNIGLENNPLSYDEIVNKLKNNPNIRLGTTEQDTSEYEGSPERTLVVDAKFDGKSKAFRDFVTTLSDDLTQEAIAVKYNGRGALIWGSKQEPKYDFDPQFFLDPTKGPVETRTQERTGGVDPAELGIDEKDIFNKAQEGQSYVKVPFERKGAVVDADKSIGGKGGFASTGDARETIEAVGKQMSITDAMALSERLYEEGPNGNTGIALREFLSDVAPNESDNIGKIIPAFSKIKYYSTGEGITSERIQELRDQYDQLAGYKDAHKNLDRQFGIKVENTLNLPTKKKGARKLGPDEGTQIRDERELGVVTPTDYRGRFGRPRSVIDKIPGHKSVPGKGIATGKQIETREDEGPRFLPQPTGKPSGDPQWVKEFLDKLVGGDKNADIAFSKYLRSIRGKELTDDMISSLNALRGVKEGDTTPSGKPFGETAAGKAKKLKDSISDALLNDAARFAWYAQRDTKGNPFDDQRTIKQIKSDFKKVDPDIRAIATNAVAEAVNTGEITVPTRDRKGNRTTTKIPFNPRNANDAQKLLNFAIKDAVREHYIGAGAPKGIVGKTSQQNTRLNKIKSAKKYLEARGLEFESQDPIELAKLLRKGFKVARKGKAVTIQEKGIKPETIERLVTLDAAITPTTGLDAVSSREGTQAQKQYADERLDLPDVAITDVLDDLRIQGGQEAATLAGLDSDTINELQNKIEEIRNQAVHGDKQINDSKLTNQITDLIAKKLNYKNLSKNYIKIAKQVTPDIETARKLAKHIKDNFIDNINNEPLSTNTQKFKRVLGRFIGAELEGNVLLGKEKGSPAGVDEFSIDSRWQGGKTQNPRHSDYGGQVHQKKYELHGPLDFEHYADTVAFYIEDHGDKMRDGQFREFSIGKNPEKFQFIKNDIENYPKFKGKWFVYKHPNGSGELVLIKGNHKPESLVLEQKRGRVGDFDARDFSESITKPGRRHEYHGFNEGAFRDYVKSMKKRLNPSSYMTAQRFDPKAGFKKENYNKMLNILKEEGLHAVPATKRTFAGKDIPVLRITDTKDNFSLGSNKADVSKAVNHLKSLNPGTNFITSKADIIKIGRRNNMSMDQIERIQGAYTRDGDVVLNVDNIGLDTPFHEVGHGWLKRFAKEAPALYEKAKKLAKKSKTYQRLKNDPWYSNYNENRLLEEVMAEDIGHKGAEIFTNAKDISRWNNFVKKAKALMAKIMGMSPEKFDSLTYGEFIEGAASDIVTSTDVLKKGRFTPKDEFSVAAAADPKLDEDIAKLQSQAIDNESKWYKPSGWIKKLIPPAADDYHGLVSKIKSIPQNLIKEVTDAFVAADHAYKDASTQVRKDVAKFTEDLGLKLSDDFGTIAGVKVNYAQAIQAIAKGYKGKGKEAAALKKLAANPKVKNYINNMTKLGVLKPDGQINSANPNYDLVQFITNDLYKKHFEGFKNKKEEVFTKEALDKVGAELGSKHQEALQNSLQRMTSGKTGSGATTKIGQKWHDFLQGSVGVTMFFNFRSAALQMLSVGNYALASNNPMSVMSKIAVGYTDPKMIKRFKQLWDSGYLKERRARAGFDVNATEMLLEAKKGNLSGFKKKLLNKGFAATSAVDSIAIAWGGAAFVQTQVENGVSEREALKAWKEQTEEAQQSSRPDRVSQYQTEGVSKFILAFANTPAQYFRLSQKAFRQIKQGKDVKKNIQKLAYYSMIQNAIFTMAQSASTALLYGLSGDDEQDKEALSAYNSMVGSYLRGMGLVGASFDAAKNVIMEAVRQEGKANPDHVATALKAISISPPLNRKIQDLVSIGRAHNFNQEDKWITTGARTLSFANLPGDWIQKKGQAAAELFDDEYSKIQSLLMLLGWSKYQFDNKEADGLFEGVNFDDAGFEDVDFENVEF